MSTCKGKPYLLGASTESHTTLVDSQLVTMLADIMAQLNTLTQIVNQIRETDNERLTKLETACEQATTEQPPLQLYTRRDLDEHYLISIKLDVLSFDGLWTSKFFSRLVTRHGVDWSG